MNFYLTLIFSVISLEKLLCENLSNECQEAFRNAALNAHNKYRAKHGSPPLKRVSSMDSKALAWSQHLAKNNIFQHSGSGENLYASYGGSISNKKECENFGNNCVNTWYNEIKNYNFNKPGFSMNTGHFTQVVWKSSTSIGLGMAAGKNPKWGNAYYCTAQYSPPGNVVGDNNKYFRNNVLPPKKLQ